MHAHEPIVAFHLELLPKDFGERLAQLVGVSCLSWEEFAERLSIECDRATEWRGGEAPTGGEVCHIMGLALSVPGGKELMLPETFGRNGVESA